MQCSISLKAVVIFIDAMHNEESNRKKPKKVEGRSLRKWCFAFAIIIVVRVLVGVEPQKMIMKGACDEDSNREEGKKYLEFEGGGILLLPFYRFW